MSQFLENQTSNKSQRGGGDLRIPDNNKPVLQVWDLRCKSITSPTTKYTTFQTKQYIPIVAGHNGIAVVAGHIGIAIVAEYF